MFTSLSNYIAQSANYTLLASDNAVGFDCTAASRTATLPDATAVQVGKPFSIRRVDSVFTNLLSIATTGGQTIDGRASLSIILSPGDSLVAVSTGSAWICLSLKETVACNVGSSNSPALVANTNTIIPWNVIGFDTHGTYAGSGVFTAKVAGYYKIDAGFYTATAAQTAFATLTSAHSSFRIGERVATGSPGQFGGSGLVYLNVGESFNAGVQSTGATNLNASSQLNYLSVVKI